MINALIEEKERLLRELADADPATEEYTKLENQLDALQKVYKTEQELDLNTERQERELNLAESKAKAELRLKEEEATVRKKESRRGVMKVILGGLFGVGQIVLLANYEEVKPLFGKAWNYIMKPRL